MKTMLKKILKNFFKNEWYYWYRGEKLLALSGWGIKILLNILLFLSSLGINGIILGLILALVNDIVIIGALILILFTKIPFKDYLGKIIIENIFFIILIWIISRFFISFIAIKKENYEF